MDILEKAEQKRDRAVLVGLNASCLDRAENADFHRIYTAADDWSEGEVS